MELVALVAVAHALHDARQAVEREALELGQVGVGDGVAARVEVAEVAEQVAEGVADLAVGLDMCLGCSLRDADVVGVVHGWRPRAAGRRRRTASVIASRRRSTLPTDFDIFSPLSSTTKPWVRHGLEGRACRASPTAGQDRRLEPAAVLVGALEVQEGGVAAARSRRSSTARWLEPDSNQTSRMSASLRNVGAAAAGAGGARRAASSATGLREPGVGALAAEEVAKCSDGSARAACCAGSSSQPSAGIGTPQARWRLMHQSGRFATMPSIRSRPQAGSQRTRRRSPASVRPRRSSWSTRDEPLLGGAEDDRLLAAPAVRVAVHERRLGDQVARARGCARRSSGWRRRRARRRARGRRR